MIFDVPRITTSTRDSVSGVNSAVIYNLDYNRFEYHNGTGWVTFLSGQNSNTVWSFNGRTGDIIFQDSDVASLGDFTASGVLTITESILLGNSGLKIGTTTVSPNVSGVTGNIGSLLLKNDGTLWQKNSSSNTDWSQIQTGEFTNEPTGFPVDGNGQVDRTSSIISFSNTSPARTFSISPASTSFTILIKGRQYRKTTTETIQISTTEGLHYIYYNESGVLSELTSFTTDLILKDVLIAVIYWDSTNNVAILFGDERHGCTMDSHTHARFHSESGAVYVSGMALNDFTVNGDGSSESHLTYSVSSGNFRDEDILHSLLSKGTNAAIPIFYRDGSSNWRSITPSVSGGTYARAIGTAGTPGQIAFNEFSGDSWTRTVVPNTNFVCYHIVASNDINNPYFIVMGNAAYPTKPEAKTAAITEISNFGGLPFTEAVFVGTILFECKTSYSNSLKAAIVSADGSNYVDWRFKTTLNPNTANINTHNNLGGIYGSSPYYHSDQPISITDSVQFNGINDSGNLVLSGISTITTSGTSTSISTANFSTIRYNSSGAGTFSGFANGTNGKILIVQNIGTGKLTILHDAATTEPESSNRILLQGNANIGLLQNHSVSFRYDGVLQKWLSLNKVNHIELNDLQGGDGTNYYHSNQPINNTDSVTFSDLKVTNEFSLYGLYNNDGLTGDITSSIFTPQNSTFSIAVNSATTFHGIGWIGSVPQGKVLLIRNTSASTNIVIANQSSTETSATRRIITGTGNNYILAPNASVLLFYDNASTRWKIIGQNRHNLFSDLQGGDGTNYYHSNQPINTSDNVIFNNINATNNLNITGTLKVKNITFPTSDGTAGQVIKTDGSGNLSFISLPGATASILDTYLNSQKATIASGATTTIQTIFTETITGIYHFWVSADPRIKGTIAVNSSDLTNSTLETVSPFVTGTQNNSLTLNVYTNGGNIVFQNNTTSSIVLVIRRETTPASGGSTGMSTLTIGSGLSGGSYNGTANTTITIDSSVATLTGSQNLTNKTLVSPIITALTVTGTTRFGSNTFTKTLGIGDLALDNGTSDTPGITFYHGNNVNYGIDTFFDGGQRLRFVKNLNEAGGAELGYFDSNANFTTNGYLNPQAFKPGQIIKDTILSNTEITVVSTTIAATTSNVDFITYSYTPMNSSSYLIIHIHISKYATGAGATGNDSWFSVLKVDGNEIAYGFQNTLNAFRTGTLFPLTGRFTNSNTTAKTIAVAARRDTADDSITIDNTATAIWLRITEVAR